jgi:hypothetical protein
VEKSRERSKISPVRKDLRCRKTNPLAELNRKADSRPARIDLFEFGERMIPAP